MNLTIPGHQHDFQLNSFDLHYSVIRYTVARINQSKTKPIIRSVIKTNCQEITVTKIIILIIAIALIGYYFLRLSGGAKPEEIAANKKLGAEFMELNKALVDVKNTDSGLQYLRLQEGTGSIHPSATNRVTVHYEGKLLDGTVFDSSVKRGKPISFGLNQVIKGWTEGVQLMVVGETTRFFIPANLAYGNKGAGSDIPGGSTLIFDVELLAINQ